MDLYYPSRILVIYGGKDHTRSVRGNQAFYCDLKVFDLVHFTWITVSISNSNPTFRFSHAAVCIGTKLIMFGGMQQKGFNKAEINFIDFRKMNIHKMYKKSIKRLALHSDGMLKRSERPKAMTKERTSTLGKFWKTTNSILQANSMMSNMFKGVNKKRKKSNKPDLLSRMAKKKQPVSAVEMYKKLDKRKIARGWAQKFKDRFMDPNTCLLDQHEIMEIWEKKDEDEGPKLVCKDGYFETPHESIYF